MGRYGDSMRAIFLDFDGVTHPVSAIADWRSLNIHGGDLQHLIEKRDLFRWLPKLAEALEDHPDVVLVIHSAWRSVVGNVQLREILGPQLEQRFMGVTSLDLTRHKGIVELALRCQMDHYLVIDDAASEFPKDWPHLIATDPETGLSDQNICLALEHWLEQTAPQQFQASVMSC